jgi:hypothetical protein
MQKIKLLLFLLLSLIFWNCSESNPSYVQNIYTNYWVEYYNLNSNSWVLLDSADRQWNQTFKMTYKSNINYGNIGIICFYKNRYKAWQALPATGIIKNENGGYYQDELTYSNDSLNLYIGYKNPDILNSIAFIDTLQIKAVFFDGKYVYPSVIVKQFENNNIKN